MKSEVASKLQALLDDRDRQKQRSEALIEERKKTELQNLDDFETAKARILRPAFQEIVDLYVARNRSIRISEHDEQSKNDGRYESPHIRLDLLPHSYSDTMKPQFRLTFDKNNRMISLWTSTTSQSGPAGTVSLDVISSEWIQDAFLKYETGTLR